MSNVGTKKEWGDEETRSKNLQFDPYSVVLEKLVELHLRVIPCYAMLQCYLILTTIKEARSTPA